jgi:hypothetical protein
MARLYATVTQGGADAFAQNSFLTGLEGQTRQAYLVNGVGYEFVLPAPPTFPRAVANQDIQLCMTRRSKTAMPLNSDVDVIKKFAWASGYSTGVGAAPLFPMIDEWVPPGRTLIVESSIYIQIDSTATTAIWAALVWIDVEIVNISEVDRLTLLTQSLV